MDVTDTFIHSSIPAGNSSLMVVLMILQVLVWIFKLYVAVRILIACNIYIKKNKKTAEKESPRPGDE